MSVPKKRRYLALAAILAAGIAGAVLSTYVDREWALYTATDTRAAYRLFLDPFPDRASCEADAAIVRRNGGFAQCRSQLTLQFDRSFHERMAGEFHDRNGAFNAMYASMDPRTARH
jgi:hypothetical protein